MTAALAGLAVVLYTGENLLPTPLPWLRLGLSNVAILIALAGLGVRPALAVFVLKVLAGSLLSGRFLSPFFFFGLVGGAASLAAMAAAWRLLVPPLSLVGVSILGGVVHITSQLLLAYFLLVRVPAIFYLTPVLVIVGAATGTLTGIAARLTLERTQELLHGTARNGRRS